MKNKIIGISLGIIVSLLVGTIAYASWLLSFPVTVTDTSNVTRTYYPVTLNATGQTYIDGGYIDANGLNSNMQLGSTDLKYMLSTNKITTVIPNLPSGGQAIASFYTGYDPPQTNFPIITGDGGYITIADNITEPSGNFSQVINHYVNTTAGNNKYEILKVGAYEVFVSPTVSGNITALVPTGNASNTGQYFPVINNSSNGSGSGTTITVTKPSSIKESDLLIVVLGAYNVAAATNLTAPAGWTQLYHTQFSTYTTNAAWYKAASASESSSQNWTSSQLSEYGYSVIAIDRNSYFGTPVSGVTVTGISVSPDPPNLVSGYGAVDTMWLANALGIGNMTAYPAGYTIISNPKANYNLSTLSYINTTAASENPGAYTLAPVAAWSSNTIAIKGQKHTDLSVTGISSGEHTITVSGNATTFSLQVDATVSTTSNVTILNNANVWTLLYGNVSPYTDNISMYVGGNRVVYYAPNTMIQGTDLVDRESTGGLNNGVITFGTNQNISLHAGIMVSNNSTSSYGSNTTVGFTMPEMPLPNNWFGTATLSPNLLFYNEFLAVSVDSGMSLRVIYFVVILGLALLFFILTAMFTKSNLLSIVVFNSFLYLNTASGIVPMWVAFSITIIQAGIMYLSRQM